jgi:hypothetical protein
MLLGAQLPLRVDITSKQENRMTSTPFIITTTLDNQYHVAVIMRDYSVNNRVMAQQFHSSDGEVIVKLSTEIQPDKTTELQSKLNGSQGRLIA